MEASIRLGRVRGIEIGIHYSWFLVFVLFTAILATQQFPDMYDDWTRAQYWSIAALAVVLLFASVLLHELAHSIVAQRKGIPVSSIVLFIFGGVATISRETEHPGDEFKIAIAGPAASVAISAFFLALWAVLGSTSEQLSALFAYLAIVNFALAIFNLVPGFPLDGGRVLRAIVWKATGNVQRATQIVSTIGVGIGTLFFALGVILILSGNLASGLWGIALGWFLQTAASQGYAAMVQKDLTANVTVRDVMNPDPPTVQPEETIQEVVEDHILGRNVRGMPVIDDGQVVGIVSLTDVKKVERQQWGYRHIREIMTPRARLYVLAPDMPLTNALEMMGQHDLNQVPVLDDGRLVGVVTRADIVRYLNMRRELGVSGARPGQPSKA